jgi:molybdopterin molybdotransferase
MLTVEEARARVLDAVTPIEPKEVLVGEALGLVAARELRAPHPLPRFDNSAMDGYAVRREDLDGASEEAPVALRVAGEMRAGGRAGVQVSPGRAVKIMTGAPVPAGADTVVPIEATDHADGRILVKERPPLGGHIRPAGDDLEEGDIVVGAGMELGPGELALLASLGLSPVSVRGAPKVAVVVTGDELVAPEEDPLEGQIRDSNSVALAALVIEAGAAVASLVRVGDHRSAVVEAFEHASEAADVIVSSGGVAVGDYDFVKEVVEELGHIDLWRVAMQPGKPVVLGSVKGTPFLGLPGNPVSIHVGFEQFVRPALRRMRGCSRLLRPRMSAELTEGIEKRKGRLHFVRVQLELREGRWFATPTGPQGSHIQSSLVDCHGVALFGQDESRLEAGSEVMVEVWHLPDRVHRPSARLIGYSAAQ